MTFRVAGENVMEPLTWTASVAALYPVADALMVAEPIPAPVACGCVAGVVAPAAIKTLVGAMVSFAVLLLLRVIVTPPLGAGAANVTGNGVD